MKTTFVQRENTNEEVYKKANDKLRTGGSQKQIIKYREFYLNTKMKRLAKRIKYDDTDIQNTTFRNAEDLEAWVQPNRTQGRPANKWTQTALREMWKEITKKKPTLRHISFDIKNSIVIEEIKEYSTNILSN